MGGGVAMHVLRRDRPQSNGSYEPSERDWELKRAVQPLRELASALGQTLHVCVNPTIGGDGTFSAFTLDGQVRCSLRAEGAQE